MTTIPGKADVIWGQIPRPLKLALNLREPVGDNETGYLHFRIGPCRKGLGKVVIQLDPSDTYTVRLIRIDRKTWQVTMLYEIDDIYAEQLGEVLMSLAERLHNHQPQGEFHDNG